MPSTESGKLFIVSTPIGNLEDITLRALRVLREVDRIAAEDSRHVRKLLTHYGISKKVSSYYQNRERTKAQELLKLLLSGSSVALVSDAGTPGISDPGTAIIREAVARDIEVVPILGASAVLVALSVCGFRTDRFVFEGFLPRKKGKRQKFLRSLTQEDRTIILFESPHRILATLTELSEIFAGRRIVLARELTKKFEEFLRGTPEEILEELSNRRVIKGEFTLIFEGNYDK